MRRLRVAVASISLLFLTALSAGQNVEYKPCSTPSGNEPVYWGYGSEIGPAHWAELSHRFRCCAEGREQSPIDLNHAVHKPLPEIVFNYRPTHLSIINDGHTIEITYERGSFIEIERTRYHLQQFHFHTPSEHTVKRLRFQMEMHLVHESDDGKKAVVGVLIRRGLRNRNYEAIWKKLPTVPCIERKLEGTQINATDLLPRHQGYYNYAGSLTTPPCTEGVSWFVLKTPVELSPAQIGAFRAIVKMNSRNLQRINHRQVLVTPK